MFALFCCLHLGNPQLDGVTVSVGSWNRVARLSNSSEEVMLQSKESCPCTGGDTNLAVNMLCVMAHGVLGDKEQSGDVLYGVPAGEETEYLDLALGEPCYHCATSRADPVARSREDSVRSLTVEPPCPHLASQRFCGS